MPKCMKCEREIRSVLENAPKGKEPGTMHKYLQEGVEFDYGEFLTEVNVELNQEVIMHAGAQALVYHGKLCERCLDDLCERAIITTVKISE